MTNSEIMRVYCGSDGAATKAMYERLAALGPAGAIAVNLLRASKTSERAKVYRGGRYRAQSYDRKQWSMDNLCTLLTAEAEKLGIRWGWGIDDKQPFHRHVLYVDLPNGQVSFHTAARGDGPDYPGAWDGLRGASASRVVSWAATLFKPEGVDGGQHAEPADA